MTSDTLSFHHIGMDPGTVNLAAIRILFHKLAYTKDGLEEIPQFDILNWELWNLKTGRGLRPKEEDCVDAKGDWVKEMGFERFRLPIARDAREPGQPDTIHTWLSSLNHFISASPWIFEERGGLADVTVENQFDHIKTAYIRHEMFLLSNVFHSSIAMLDLEANKAHLPHRLHYRIFAQRSLKYGMRNDGALGYGDRKETSEAIAHSLLGLLDKKEWLDFLRKVEESGQKLDDLCDALLLALQECVTRYEEKRKSARKVRPSEPVSTGEGEMVPAFPEPVKKKRKRSQSSTIEKKLPVKKRITEKVPVKEPEPKKKLPAKPAKEKPAKARTSSKKEATIVEFMDIQYNKEDQEATERSLKRKRGQNDSNKKTVSNKRAKTEICLDLC